MLDSVTPTGATRLDAARTIFDSPLVCEATGIQIPAKVAPADEPRFESRANFGIIRLCDAKNAGPDWIGDSPPADLGELGYWVEIAIDALIKSRDASPAQPPPTQRRARDA